MNARQQCKRKQTSLFTSLFLAYRINIHDLHALILCYALWFVLNALLWCEFTSTKNCICIWIFNENQMSIEINNLTRQNEFSPFIIFVVRSGAMSKRSAKLRSKCNKNWYKIRRIRSLNRIKLVVYFPGRPIQYQVIERRRPNVITLHGETVI